VIKKFEPNFFLKKWKEDVGEEEAARVCQNAARLGTRVHKINETFLIKPEVYEDAIKGYSPEELYRHNLYKIFLEGVTPLFVEKKFIMDLGDSKGYGGSPDLIGIVENAKMQEVLDFNPHSESEVSVIVVDYKNWSKPKYAGNLLSYYLQLAAYSRMAQSSLPEGLELKSAYILGTAADKGFLYIYALDAEKLAWYNYWFTQMVTCFFEHTEFDWFSFEKSSKEKYLARRLKYANSTPPSEDTTEPLELSV
jgi:hypothetical protein